MAAGKKRKEVALSQMQAQINADRSELLAASRTLSTAGKVAVLVCAAAAVISGVMLTTLVIDVARPAPTELAKPDDAKRNADEQKTAFDSYVAQITGRSLFYVPEPPRAPEPTEAPVDADKPPPPPSSYGGPGMVAMLSDSVWFANGKRLKVGEKDGDLEVAGLVPPWTAKLNWKGVPFDVTLFERSKLGKDPKAAASPADKLSDKPIEDKAEGAGQPDADKTSKEGTPDAAGGETPPPEGEKDAPKPDPEKPDAEKPDAEKPDPEKPDAQKPAPAKPEEDRPGGGKPPTEPVPDTNPQKPEAAPGTAPDPKPDPKPDPQ